jgi:FlaG/FlaF family flagellin (archaellin)
MKRRRTILIVGLVIAVLLVSAIAWAKPQYLKVFMATYTISSTSTLGKAQCAVCHPSKTKTDTLNPYGKDIQAVMQAQKTKVLTKDILQRFQNLDSDKDGFTNITEIKADTLPGDPRSHPSK